MENNTATQKNTPKIKQDALDFFLGKVSGNLWPYLYGKPRDKNDLTRGGILYNEMLESEEDYYLYKYESELFRSKGKSIASKIGSNATFIELGPGSEQSIRQKTLPLLCACPVLKGYVGIDISQAFLDKVIAVISSEFPGIYTDDICQDFTLLETLPKFENSVIFFKGSTIANMRRDEVSSFIKKIKNLAGENHYLLLVHDCNQDCDSLMAAYDNKGMAAFMENIMYRVQRDLEIDDMLPGEFTYKPVWDVQNHDLKHTLTVQREQVFVVEGHEINVKEGQVFHTLSSFKYPIKVFQDMMSVTGYQPIDVFLDSSGRMAAHLFQG